MVMGDAVDCTALGHTSSSQLQDSIEIWHTAVHHHITLFYKLSRNMK